MKYKDFYSALLKSGWRVKSVNGNHYKLVKDGTADEIIMPVHNGDMKSGLYRALLKIAKKNGGLK